MKSKDPHGNTGRPRGPLSRRAASGHGLAAAGLASMVAMILGAVCGGGLSCSSAATQAGEPIPEQRDLDGRYETSAAAAPRVILVVGPSDASPIAPEPERKPAAASRNRTSPITLRALSGRDLAPASPTADEKPGAGQNASAAVPANPAADVPKPAGSRRANPAPGRQPEAPRGHSPILPAQPAQPVEEVRTPPPAQFDLDSRPISAVTTNIRCRQGDLPQDAARDRLKAMSDRSYNELTEREWDRLCYFWETPAMRHQPLYFEEVNLERYGYCWPGFKAVQPALSGAQFFATFPLLPYKMWCEPPTECDYTLGQYRPGSPVPYRVQLPCWRPGAGVAEAGAVAGLILLIP